MAYISKIKLQDTTYEIIADKNTEKKVLATQEYVDGRFDQILDGVTEEELNTFKELSDALNDDENFATAVNNELAKKTVTTLKKWTSSDI